MISKEEKQKVMSIITEFEVSSKGKTFKSKQFGKKDFYKIVDESDASFTITTKNGSMTIDWDEGENSILFEEHGAFEEQGTDEYKISEYIRSAELMMEDIFNNLKPIPKKKQTMRP